jgi:hypothetical protein
LIENDTGSTGKGCAVDTKAALVIALCPLIASVAAPSASVAQTRKIDGYEGYKFGMTLEQALKVRPSAKQTQCEYQNVTQCIEYETTVSAFPAKVTVQFHPAVVQILVTFYSMDDPIDRSCREIGKELLKLMVPKYGSDPFIKDHKATWTSPEGGSVSLTALCTGPEKGINIISYQPTGAL